MGVCFHMPRFPPVPTDVSSPDRGVASRGAPISVSNIGGPSRWAAAEPAGDEGAVASLV